MKASEDNQGSQDFRDQAFREKENEMKEPVLVCSGCCNKAPELSVFNNRNLVLTVPEAGETKTKVLADLFQVRLTSWLADDPFLPVSSHGGGERGRKIL